MVKVVPQTSACRPRLDRHDTAGSEGMVPLAPKCPQCRYAAPVLTRARRPDRVTRTRQSVTPALCSVTRGASSALDLPGRQPSVWRQHPPEQAADQQRQGDHPRGVSAAAEQHPPRPAGRSAVGGVRLAARMSAEKHRLYRPALLPLVVSREARGDHVISRPFFAVDSPVPFRLSLTQILTQTAPTRWAARLSALGEVLAHGARIAVHRVGSRVGRTPAPPARSVKVRCRRRPPSQAGALALVAGTARLERAPGPATSCR